MTRTKDPPSGDHECTLPEANDQTHALDLKEKALQAYNDSKRLYDTTDFARWREEMGVNTCKACEASKTGAICAFKGISWYCTYCQAIKRTCSSVITFRKAMVVREFGISGETYDSWLREWKDAGVLDLRSGGSKRSGKVKRAGDPSNDGGTRGRHKTGNVNPSPVHESGDAPNELDAGQVYKTGNSPPIVCFSSYPVVVKSSPSTPQPDLTSRAPTATVTAATQLLPHQHGMPPPEATRFRISVPTNGTSILDKTTVAPPAAADVTPSATLPSTTTRPSAPVVVSPLGDASNDPAPNSPHNLNHTGADDRETPSLNLQDALARARALALRARIEARFQSTLYNTRDGADRRPAASASSNPLVAGANVAESGRGIQVRTMVIDRLPQASQAPRLVSTGTHNAVNGGDAGVPAPPPLSASKSAQSLPSVTPSTLPIIPVPSLPPPVIPAPAPSLPALPNSLQPAPSNQPKDASSYSYDELLIRHQELLSVHTSLQDQNIRLRASSNAVKKENKELRQSVATLTEAKSRLVVESVAILREKEEAVKARDEAQKTLSEKEVNISAKMGEVLLKERLRKEEKTKLKEKIEGLEERVKGLVIEKTALAAAHDAFTREAEATKEVITKQLNVSESKAHALDEANRGLISTNGALGKEKEDMKIHSETMRAELTRMMGQLEEMKSIVSGWESRKAKDGRCSDDCRKKRELVQELQRENSTLVERNGELVREKEEAEMRAQEMEGKFGTLHSQSEGVKAFIVKLLERDSDTGSETAAGVPHVQQEGAQGSPPPLEVEKRDPSEVINTSSFHLGRIPNDQLVSAPLDAPASTPAPEDATINQEKQEMAVEKEGLKKDKASLRRRCTEFNRRNDEFSKRFAAHRTSATASVSEGPSSSPSCAREEAILNQERGALQLEREALEREGVELKRRVADCNKRHDEVKKRVGAIVADSGQDSRAPSLFSPATTPAPEPELNPIAPPREEIASTQLGKVQILPNESEALKQGQDRSGQGIDGPTELDEEPDRSPPSTQSRQGLSQTLKPTSSSTLVSPLSSDISQKLAGSTDFMATNISGQDRLGSMLLSQIGSWSTMTGLVQKCLVIASTFFSAHSPPRSPFTAHPPLSPLNDDEKTLQNAATPNIAPAMSITILPSLKSLRSHLEVMHHVCSEREQALATAVNSISHTFQEMLAADCQNGEPRTNKREMREGIENGKDMDGRAGVAAIAVEPVSSEVRRPASPSAEASLDALSRRESVQRGRKQACGLEVGREERELGRIRRRERQLLLLDLEEEVECRKAELRLKRLKRQILREDDDMGDERESDMEGADEDAEEGLESRWMDVSLGGKRKLKTAEDISLRPARRRREYTVGGFNERFLDPQISSSRRKRPRPRELQDAEFSSNEDASYDSELALPPTKRHSSALSTTSWRTR
ncbi:hypothetical protein ONZ45_g6052 [Pleurotus djamor]|nr:hypothetical protein ONZ45_g6052 [Pleurotus djamor]